MARPKKDESIRRTKNVMVRFTDVEYALVSCSAEQAGYPVAVYVRKQAITEKLHVHYNIVADIAELRDFARQLSHIGNNLNQIAAFFNSGGIQSRAMLEEINRCMTDLRAMRKEIAGLAGDYRGNLKTLAVDTKQATIKSTATANLAGIISSIKYATLSALLLPATPTNTPAVRNIRIIVIIFLSAKPDAIISSFLSKATPLFCIQATRIATRNAAIIGIL